MMPEVVFIPEHDNRNDNTSDRGPKQRIIRGKVQYYRNGYDNENEEFQGLNERDHPVLMDLIENFFFETNI